MKNFLVFIKTNLKNIVLLAIIGYQKTFSFDHGPLARIFPFLGCCFYPSCSQYTYEAVDKYGIFKGCWLGLKRVIRCNPLSKGGHDPLL
ncbi:MAG: membrane protein insertion efficiency factor YidD [Candidatus Parcubacteria bacterium]|nr:membrane protein insertion efficiency factor YidD [Candidatus Parcubacteria bacterium]